MAPSPNRSHDSLATISGTWHLLHEATDERDLPSHRMDFHFEQRDGQLRAAVLSRATGERMSMIHEVSFDGRKLRLQMLPPAGRTQGDMPLLVMTVAGSTLRGGWQYNDVQLGPGLKLVRGQ